MGDARVEAARAAAAKKDAELKAERTASRSTNKSTAVEVKSQPKSGTSFSNVSKSTQQIWEDARAKQAAGQWDDSDVTQLRSDIAKAQGSSSWEALKTSAAEKVRSTSGPSYPTSGAPSPPPLTLNVDSSGRIIQASEADVIAGNVSKEQRAAEQAAVFAFYKDGSDSEVKRKANNAYLKSLGYDVPDADTPLTSMLAGGKDLFASDVYDPAYASLGDRATTEHVLQLANELGIPVEQPKTREEKEAAMVLRRELVERLKAEGIDSGKAWALAREASYNQQEPDRFEKLYGVDVGSSLKPMESERILDEMRALKDSLSFKAGKIADQYSGVRQGYLDEGFYTRGKGRTEASAGALEGTPPGTVPQGTLLRAQLREQMNLLRQQSDVVGAFVDRFEKGKRADFGSVESTVKRPDLYTMIPRGGGLDINKAIESGYTDTELEGLGVSASQINSARTMNDLIDRGVVERHYIDPATMQQVPRGAPT